MNNYISSCKVLNKDLDKDGGLFLMFLSCSSHVPLSVAASSPPDAKQLFTA